MPAPNAFSERMPPVSYEAEQSVLGAMLVDPTVIPRVTSILRAEDFYAEKNRWVYVAILKAAKEGAVDLITVQDVLRRQRVAGVSPGSESNLLEEAGGLQYLMTLTNTVPTTANVEQYAQIVANKSTLRQLQDSARKVVDDCYEAEDAGQAVAQAQASVQKVAMGRRSAEQLKGFEGLPQWLYEYMTTPDVGLIPTGFDDLDDVYEIRVKEVHAIAGPAKAGKSTLARAWGRNMAQDGTHVLYLSLEEPRESQMINFLSMDSGVRRDLFRRKLIKPGTDNINWIYLQEAAQRLEPLPIRFDFTAEHTCASIAAKVQYHALTWGIDVVIVDTQNALSEQRASKSETTAELRLRIVREMKLLAAKVNCAIVLVIQAGHEIYTRDSFWMTPMDVAESRLQVQAFDGVLGILRPEKIQNPKSHIYYDGKKLFAADKRWKNVMAVFTVAARNCEENIITPVYCDLTAHQLGNLALEYYPWRMPDEAPPPKEALKPRLKREQRQRQVESDPDVSF